MSPLPQSSIATASQRLAEGWRPAAERGRLTAPVGEQRGGIFLTDDQTWQAMALMQLLAAGKVLD